MIIFVNLFIAIILGNFDEINNKKSQLLSDNNMDKFRESWAKFDPEGTFFLNVKDLVPFLTDLGEPLGFNEHEINDKKA